jgi:hypothetical protein
MPWRKVPQEDQSIEIVENLHFSRSSFTHFTQLLRVWFIFHILEGQLSTKLAFQFHSVGRHSENLNSDAILPEPSQALLFISGRLYLSFIEKLANSSLLLIGIS